MRSVHRIEMLDMRFIFGLASSGRTCGDGLEIKLEVLKSPPPWNEDLVYICRVEKPTANETECVQGRSQLQRITLCAQGRSQLR